MAKVYATPQGIDPPDFHDAMVDGRYDMARDDELHAAFFDRLRQWLKDHNYNSDLAGEIVYFPIADGNAAYMIVSLKPAVIMHLPIHDAWSIPAAHARGLTAADLRQMVEGSRLAALFAKKDR